MRGYRKLNIHFLWDYTKTFKFEFVLGFACMLFSLASIFWLGHIIPKAIPQIIQHDHLYQLLPSLYKMIGAVVIYSASSWGHVYYLGLLGEKIVQKLRNDIYNHLLSQDIDFFENHKIGDVTSYILSDSQIIQNLLIGCLPCAILNTCIIFVASIMLANINWTVFGIIICTLPLITAPIIFFGQKITTKCKDIQTKIADVSSHVSEATLAMHTLKSFSFEKQSITQFHLKTLEARDSVVDWIKTNAVTTATMPLISFGIVILVLFAILKNDIGFTDIRFHAFFYYAGLILCALNQLCSVSPHIYKTKASLERLKDLFNLQSKEKDGIPFEFGDIEFKDVCFEYKKNSKIKTIDHINLQIKAGQKIGIIGRSGIGKTTLIYLLLRFRHHSSGKILINNIPIENFRVSDLRKNIGYLPQEPFIFSASIIDNIRLNNTMAPCEKVRNAALIANALEFIERLPNGFDTVIGEKGVKLSGGEKQRIALARIILKDPPIVLLDEPTSALDHNTEKCINKALDKFLERRTCITITHRLSTIESCDQIYRLQSGKLTNGYNPKTQNDFLSTIVA